MLEFSKFHPALFTMRDQRLTIPKPIWGSAGDSEWSKLGSPAVAGIDWSLLKHDEFPQTPILSILQLDLYPGSGIQDTNRPACRIWNASLDYVSSISGCVALHWAQLEDNADTLIVLLQWEDPYGWKRFQESVGFRLMKDLLTPNCFNRAARLALPTIPKPADYCLELVSFQFDSVSSNERRQLFESEWQQLVMTMNRSSAVIILGEWVERDVPYNRHDPDRARSLDASQPTYFLGFFFWGPDIRGQDLTHLSRQVATLQDLANVSTSISTSSLRTKTSTPERNVITETSQTFERIDSLSSLLSIQIPRKHRDDGQFPLGVDVWFSDSLDDARQDKRLHAGPRGIHIPMGWVNQYSPYLRPLRQKPLSINKLDEGVFDIFWMKMTVEDRELWTSEQPWRGFHRNTSALLGAKIYRAKLEGRPDCFAILFCEWFLRHPYISWAKFNSLAFLRRKK